MSPKKRLGNDPFEAQPDGIPTESQSAHVNVGTIKPTVKRGKKATEAKNTAPLLSANELPEIRAELKHTKGLIAEQQQEITSLKQEIEVLKRKARPRPNLAELQKTWIKFWFPWLRFK